MLHVEVHVEHVAGLVVVLPHRRGADLADGVVVHDGGGHRLARVPGLGDPPLQVFGVLRPPEQLGHRQADHLDDLVGDRAVALARHREDKRSIRVPVGDFPQALEAHGLGQHVVVEHPRVRVAGVEEPGQRLGVATGRPGVDVGAH
jgi:hypothetical protein